MIFILTGPVHIGKTTLLERIVYELKKEKIDIDGFLSESVLENQEVIGYDLCDIKEEESIPFIRKEGERDWQRIGPFFFIPQGLARAKEIIFRGKENALLIVDEVGPLELGGKGLWPALKEVIFQPLKRSVLVVRANILEDFLAMLGKSEVKVFDIKEEGVFSHILSGILGVSKFLL
jgi:nucleoside-triphosphatase THEP1